MLEDFEDAGGLPRDYGGGVPTKESTYILSRKILELSFLLTFLPFLAMVSPT